MMEAAYSYSPADPGLGSWLSQALKKTEKVANKIVPLAKKMPLQHFANVDKPSPTENALYASDAEVKSAEADLAAAQAEAQKTAVTPAVAASAKKAGAGGQGGGATVGGAVPFYKNPWFIGGSAAAGVLLLVLLVRRRS